MLTQNFEFYWNIASKAGLCDFLDYCKDSLNKPKLTMGNYCFFLPMYPLGGMWVFSVYQPNYDPSAADGVYCNKTLYTFAFWNALLEMFGFGVHLAKFCKGMLCYVHMTPVDADFYRNVWEFIWLLESFMYDFTFVKLWLLDIMFKVTNT